MCWGAIAGMRLGEKLADIDATLLTDPRYFGLARQPVHVRPLHLAWHRDERIRRTCGAAPATRLAQIIPAHQPPYQTGGEGVA